MNERIPSIEDLELQGVTTFIRVDFNVPLQKDQIIDDTRIRAALPTVEFALKQGARVVLASHLGRPHGQIRPEFSMEPVALRLAELLSTGEVRLTDHCVGDGSRKVIQDLRDGQVALLENLRFHPGELQNDLNFAKQFAISCGAYINDAFGSIHRAHASISALPRLIEKRAAGFLLANELVALDKLKFNPPKPFIAVLGGAKVTDKIDVMKSMLDQVDIILIGGSMANTFLAAQGMDLGLSHFEKDKLPLARSLMAAADLGGVILVLPTDVRVGKRLNSQSAKVTTIDSIPKDAMALDIGPQTERLFREHLRRAQAIFWNGPMGLMENQAFAQGTMYIARAVADCPGFNMVGGGDSVAAVQQMGIQSRYSYISTGGGASLGYLEGCPLPGLEALRGS